MLRAGVRKVPEITLGFWVAKLFTTALGESVSDYGVYRIDPVVAVLCGFVFFVLALGLQLWQPRFSMWRYWLAVTSVAIFGTMCADVLHVKFGVSYAVDTALFGVVLAGIFAAWYASERTLSIHSIDRPRREWWYWATVLCTFALGTAVGDLVATPLKLGYFGAAALFGGLMVVPLAGWRLGVSSVACFWTAYVLTRPLGASLADGFGKAKHVSGLGLGDGPVAACFLAAAAVVVAVLAARSRREAGVAPSAVAPR